jgi:hypothetical protein
MIHRFRKIMSSELPEESRLILSPEELRRVTSFFMILREMDQTQKAKQNDKNKEKINENA